jgi:hypothetical protein
LRGSSPQPAQLTGDQFWVRYGHWNMPEKFEATDGKLFWSNEQRLHVLRILIESLGTEAVQAFIDQHRV